MRMLSFAPMKHEAALKANTEVAAIAAAINQQYLGDEGFCVNRLMEIARLDEGAGARVDARASALVEAVRANRIRKSGLDAFLRQYDLSSQEGVILMCLAEALLRIPDDATADKLIADKIASGNWAAHLGSADSIFVNASTWGLMLTGELVRPARTDVEDPRNFVMRLVGRIGEPMVRAAFRHAMRVMGHQFVMGRTIDEALARARSTEHRQYRHSYDMLGEAALTAKDADRYFDAYRNAIRAIGLAAGDTLDAAAAPSISVKLSALHPRYEFAQHERVLAELTPRVIELAFAARSAKINLTIDAEESDRLELSLELIRAVCMSPALTGWNGFGLAVQAYQKRALDVVKFLIELARTTQRRLNVRLVKGAYWDSEIKRTQERGLTSYPVFTRKVSTDVSYIACARILLQAGEWIYPQFATHNAQTVATVLELTRDRPRSFEFQRLHGMGEELYTELVGAEQGGHACRVYAPVGTHEDLLPYLVRRLLENGANTSFVNRIVDENTPIEQMVMNPVAVLDELASKPHPRIPPPRFLYGESRKNSSGVNLADGGALAKLVSAFEEAASVRWDARPVVDGAHGKGASRPLCNPARTAEIIGSVIDADAAAIDRAFQAASAAHARWNDTSGAQRADILREAADRLEERLPEFLAYLAREAGRTIPDSIAEVREAVDFMRYYASRADLEFAGDEKLPGPTGEANTLQLQGRGVFVCISPWNFPLAIFAGQVVAALAAGNAVIAKPAEQTPFVAFKTIELLHAAGVPKDVLHFCPGDGEVGARLVADPRVAGVAFTGSTDVAQRINRSLAAKSGAIATLIAETGGQNAMIVDSSALPEQVVLDVVQSGFNSAGQRCSALRVLFVQEEIATRVEELLAGYMDELVLGEPRWLATDIGPVIDADARHMLEQHVATITRGAKWQHRAKTSAGNVGYYFAPLAVEIDSLSQLQNEVFGPIVHVIRYASHEIDRVIDDINRTQFGLTLGIHSRIDSWIDHIVRRVRVGNIYVNRNMIGAVVGVQPFGGMGLSGTGPKAGGPHYLHRFATERTVTVNTAAAGGNASLLALE